MYYLPLSLYPVFLLLFAALYCDFVDAVNSNKCQYSSICIGNLSLPVTLIFIILFIIRNLMYILIFISESIIKIACVIVQLYHRYGLSFAYSFFNSMRSTGTSALFNISNVNTADNILFGVSFRVALHLFILMRILLYRSLCCGYFSCLLLIFSFMLHFEC